MIGVGRRGCPASVSDRFERHGPAVDLDDVWRRAGRHLDEREALEDSDVADRLAVETVRGDRGDQVRGLDALVTAGVRDQLYIAGAVDRRGLVVRLAMAAWTRLGGRGGRDPRALDPRRDRRGGMALDRLELAPLAWLDEGDRAARAADAAGAPDPVHVDVGRGRHVEVDDVRDRRDVEAARGDVRGHEDRRPAALEVDHHAVARALAHVAVQRLDVQPAVLERAVELLAADLRAHEDDRLLRALGLHDAHERVR